MHGWGVVGVSSQGSWRVSSQGSWGRERVSAKQGRPCSGPFEWPGIRDGSVAHMTPALQQEPAGQAEAAKPARSRSGPGRRLRVCTTQLPVTYRHCRLGPGSPSDSVGLCQPAVAGRSLPARALPATAECSTVAECLDRLMSWGQYQVGLSRRQQGLLGTFSVTCTVATITCYLRWDTPLAVKYTDN